VRDPNALDSALAQPSMTFAGENLSPTDVEKAAVLGFALVKNHPFVVKNHPFVDGNKRIGIGHAPMVATFLMMLNGYEIVASPDEQERVMSELAAGRLGRAEVTEW